MKLLPNGEIAKQPRLERFVELVHWALKGLPLPQKFSVIAIAQAPYPDRENHLAFSKAQGKDVPASVLYARVLSGPLEGRTIVLRVRPPTDSERDDEDSLCSPTVGLFDHLDGEPCGKGAFLDPLDETRIDPLPRVDILMSRHGARLFHQAFYRTTVASLGVNPAKVAGSNGIRFSPFYVQFDVTCNRFASDGSAAEPAISNFCYQVPSRLLSRQELLERPMGPLASRIPQPFFAELLGGLCRLWQNPRILTKLPGDFLRWLNAPTSFEVTGLLGGLEEGQAEFDSFFGLRRVAVTGGPLAGQALFLRLFDKGMLRTEQGYAFLPAPFGPANPVFLPHPPEAQSGADKDITHPPTVRARGNPRRIGEVRFFLSNDELRKKLFSVLSTEIAKVSFVVNRSKWPFSATHEVTELKIELRGHLAPSLSTDEEEEGGSGEGEASIPLIN